MKKQKVPIFNLDDEEQMLSDALDRDEYKRVKNLEQEKNKIRIAAKNYLKKEAKINIRLSISDLDRIKELAAYEGLPYQTLIGSVLHKFASGHLDAERH